MIGQPCACSCVRSSPGPGDLPSLLGGRWRRGHWKNPEEDFHMSLEGGVGGGCRFLEETGSEMQLGCQTMLESSNISSASPGLFNLRAKLSSDIYGALPSTLSDPQLSRSNRIEHVHERHKGNWSNVSEAVFHSERSENLIRYKLTTREIDTDQTVKHACLYRGRLKSVRQVW